MGTPEFFDASTSSFTKLVDVFAGRATTIPAAELASTAVRVHHSAPDGLQLFELRLEPGTRGEPHAHVEDEIIVVVEGELRFGARTLGAGSSVMVPGGTLYAFVAGPEGCTFLNFRPRVDSSYITRAEFVHGAVGEDMPTLE
jgi:quercetin dioxygenase-like cupin family protein